MRGGGDDGIEVFLAGDDVRGELFGGRAQFGEEFRVFLDGDEFRADRFARGKVGQRRK